MSDEPEVEPTSRVNQEWPTSLKEAVQDKVGKRGLTQFTVLAVQRQLDDGGADLVAEARDARDLAQRLANVLATVVDNEARLTFLSSVVLPDWIDTRSWPNEVLSRLSDIQTSEEPEPTSDPEPEPEVDPTPEFKKVASVTTTRVEPKPGDVGTSSEPVIYPEGKINSMDAPKYALLQHVHSPDGRCLKNLFIERGDDGKKHCPLVDETPAPSPLDLPHDGATGDNLFERLKQSGALKSASEIPTPEPKEEAAVAPVPITPVESTSPPEQEQAVVSRQVEGVVAHTTGPGSGPLPPIPDEQYAPDATPLTPPPPAAEGKCPECGDELVVGECWSCGYGAAS